MIDHLHALPEGYRLQEYTLTGALGFGGFGITYSALDTNLDKVIAIKEYLPGELAARVGGSTVSVKSEQDRESFDWGLGAFLEEAKTVARFDHRNIVKIYRYFEQNNTAYIVMEFLQGRTLASVLKGKDTLQESEIRQWLWPVIEGLKVVHKTGYLHRDIKPANIMMRDDGRPCLLDFGAARIAIGGRTRSLTTIMTPGYAPIEQYASRGNQGPWTDIYALAAVMYGCITGHKPLDAMDRVIEDTLAPLQSSSGKTYSPGLIRGITAALAFREDTRPQSLDEWLMMLDAPAQERTVVMPAFAEREPTLKMPDAAKQGAKKQEPATESPGMPEEEPTEKAPETRRPETNRVSATPRAKAKPRKYAAKGRPVQAPPANKSRGVGKWLAVASVVILITALGLYGWMSDKDEKTNSRVLSTPIQQKPELVVQKPQSKPVTPYYGIYVRSAPSGANIYIDNEFVGVTPASLSSFQKGRTATVRLALYGYEKQQQVVTAPYTGSRVVYLTLKKIIRKYALTIRPVPANATVKILNIKPRYHHGVLLEPGPYHVEVSRYGYITKRLWVEISNQNMTQRISLTAKPAQIAKKQTSQQQLAADRLAKVEAAADKKERGRMAEMREADQLFKNKSMKETLSSVNKLYKKYRWVIDKHKYATSVKMGKNNQLEIKSTWYAGLFFGNTRYSVDPCSCGLTAAATFTNVWVARFSTRLNKKCIYNSTSEKWVNTAYEYIDFGSNQSEARKMAAGLRRIVTLACAN